MTETTMRVTGARFLHYDPRPAPEPLWKRAAMTLAGHLAWTVLLGAVVLVGGELILLMRGVL